MNSFRVHAPECGNIASLVYLVVVYIRHRASMAPGQRAVACEEVRIGSSDLSIQVSGASVSNVNTRSSKPRNVFHRRRCWWCGDGRQ